MSIHISKNLPEDDPGEGMHIPEDAGLCLMCFGKGVRYADFGRASELCPVCLGTCHQTPESVRMFKLAKLL